jgi:DNA-3-methyladenine glycosylase
MYNSRHMEILQLLSENPLEAAPRLLGAVLHFEGMSARLVETEAYLTPDDPGCHAHRGETPRNRAMFGPPGRAYIYFTYGNHWMLNVTAFPEGRAGAVLIRAAEPLSGQGQMLSRRLKAKSDRDLLSGPGKLCQAMGIDVAQYGLDLFDPSSPLRLEIGEPVCKVQTGPRIGLAPGKGDDFPWRYVDADRLECVSRPLPPGSR